MENSTPVTQIYTWTLKNLIFALMPATLHSAKHEALHRKFKLQYDQFLSLSQTKRMLLPQGLCQKLFIHSLPRHWVRHRTARPHSQQATSKSSPTNAIHVRVDSSSSEYAPASPRDRPAVCRVSNPSCQYRLLLAKKNRLVFSVL
mmetsp:Transcript_12085/g.24881  ORF Transcript_12085/g.24881 Transcript_12085/m.24881 type:complete len:145 (-) Transcript_12085:527-961(-)